MSTYGMVVYLSYLRFQCFDASEKVSARIHQQTEPLTSRARYVPARGTKTGRRETVQISARCLIFLLSSLDRRRLLAGDDGVSTPRDGESPRVVQHAGS